jgi:hypothetical protein
MGYESWAKGLLTGAEHSLAGLLSADPDRNPEPTVHCALCGETKAPLLLIGLVPTEAPFMLPRRGAGDHIITATSNSGWFSYIRKTGRFAGPYRAVLYVDRRYGESLARTSAKC